MSLPLVTHPYYSYAFANNHRFPMQKFRLLHEYLREQGIAQPENTYRPGTAKMQLLAVAHCPDYLMRFVANRLDKKELRQMGLPWSEGLVRRTLISPVGTLLTCQLALKHGIACHLVEEAFRLEGLKVVYKFYPGARSFKQAENRTSVCTH